MIADYYRQGELIPKSKNGDEYKGELLPPRRSDTEVRFTQVLAQNLRTLN